MNARKMKIIVAMDADAGIGKNGGIPWRLKKDMEHFVKMTTKVEDPSKINAVVMGRKCWESIPEKRRPLVNRLNIILTRQINYNPLPLIKKEEQPENLIVLNDFDEVFKVLSTEPYLSKIESIWNIGGAEIYDLAIRKKAVDEIYVTHIFKRFNADVVFQNFDASKLKRLYENEMETMLNEEKDVRFEFAKYLIPVD